MTDEVQIRKYTDSDLEAVLAILRLNTPLYFSPEEESELLYYLENEVEHYFVLETERQVIGSGGFNFSGKRTTAKISWDLLHPAFQRKSLGSRLLKYRLKQLQQFTRSKKSPSELRNWHIRSTKNTVSSLLK